MDKFVFVDTTSDNMVTTSDKKYHFSNEVNGWLEICDYFNTDAADEWIVVKLRDDPEKKTKIVLHNVNGKSTPIDGSWLIQIIHINPLTMR